VYCACLREVQATVPAGAQYIQDGVSSGGTPQPLLLSPLRLTTVNALSMANYSQAPPTYQPAGAPYKAPDTDADASSPLLGSSRAGASGAVYDMPEANDLPDDFKVFSLRPRLYGC
jgi:hypothetical protein